MPLKPAARHARPTRRWTGVCPAASIGLDPAAAAQVPPDVSQRPMTDFEPPLRLRSPTAQTLPVRLQLAAFRRASIPALPRRLAARRRGAAALGGRLRRRAVRRRRRARRAADDGAHFPRAYLDVNREPYELDPRMFDGRLPPFANTRSMRVAGGLGTDRRASSAKSRRSTRARLPVDEALQRIEGLYKPYHGRCAGCSTATHAQFGDAVLIDCHSMPSTSLARDERRHGRHRARRPLRHQLRAGAHRPRRRTLLRGAGYAVRAQQALCRRLHHRALRQPGARPATPCRSRSTAPSTWTSARLPGGRIRRRRRRSARRLRGRSRPRSSGELSPRRMAAE